MARRHVAVKKKLEAAEESTPSFFGDGEEAPPPSKNGARTSALAKVAGEFKMFRPASEVLTRVRAVPTIFPDYDHAVRVGGQPIERFTLLSGPSGEGKTFFTIGLLKSFLKRDHFGVLIDAERTTPITWLETAMGEYARHPGFFAKRPETYEQTVSDVRNFLNTLKRLRDANKVPEDTTAIIVVDSIRKLVPEDIFKRITKEAKEKGEEKVKVRDRSAQIKAMMNSAWMDEVVPLLELTQAAMLIITRETVEKPAGGFSFAGPTVNLMGGVAMYFDASLVLRTERAKYVTKTNEREDGSFAKSDIYGERHRITIRKTKVSGKEDKQTVCHFHTSNGVLIPEGFDRARDVLDIATRFEIVEKKGGWLKFGRHKWQGDHAAVKKLTADEETLNALEATVRKQFKNVNPIEVEDE